MKYSGMQKQLLADYALRKREFREDQIYMETEVAQGKVDKLRLKIALAEEQNKCEAVTFQTQQASLQLEDKMKSLGLQTIGGIMDSNLGSQDASQLKAEMTIGSAKDEKDRSSLRNPHYNSQDQTNVTSQMQHLASSQEHADDYATIALGGAVTTLQNDTTVGG